jgi:uncharacterized membrane protein
MLVDHVRDFTLPLGFDPMSPTQGSAAMFFTRWVTHLCAPSFVLLMGVSAALRARRDPTGVDGWLVTRGLWLLALELSWVSFSWFWSLSYLHLGVLFALGGAMLLLAPARRLPPPVALGLGAALPVLATVTPTAVWTRFWLRPGGEVPLAEGLRIGGAYAVLPWFGVALIGYAVTPWLIRAPSRALVGGGAALIGGGLALRALGVGDPAPFGGPLRWLDVTKYPPSPVFLLWTLGAAAVALGLLPRLPAALRAPLATLGRASLFFYVLHLPVAHLAGDLVNRLRFGQTPAPAGAPASAALVWGLTLALLVPLTAACAGWTGLKARHAHRPWAGLPLRWL